MIANRLPLEQKALWIAVILSQIVIGLTSIILPVPYVIGLVFAALMLVIFYSKPIIGLLLLVPFLGNYPIIFFSIGRADITLFEVAFLITFLCWILSWIREKEFRLYGSATDIPIFLLFCWVVFSLFWTIDVSRGMFQILHMIPGFITYYLFIHMTKDKKDFNLILIVWILWALVSSIMGFYETIIYGINAASKLTISETYTHLTREVRTTSFFISPDDLGLLLSLSIVLVITKYTITRSRYWKFLLLIFLPVMLFVLLSTFSRKSYLSFSAAAIYLSWRNRKALTTFLGIAIVGVLMFIVLASTGFLDLLLNRLQSYFYAPEVTITGRWTAWGIALKLFSQSPILGNGAGSFFVYAQILESPLNIPHDFYLYIISELGLVGLGLVLFWYFRILRSFSNFYRLSKDKSANIIATGVVCGLIILLFQSFFRTFQLTDPFFWGFLGISSAFLKVYMPEKNGDSLDTKVPHVEGKND